MIQRNGQEDKEQVFDAAESLLLSLAAMTGMMADLKALPENLQAAAGSGFSTATDIADWLVREKGMAFRDAHHVTGAIVALAERQGKEIHQLDIKDMQALCPDINDSIYSVLSVENSVASRTSYGGTAPVQVRAQIARWEEKLKE